MSCEILNTLVRITLLALLFESPGSGPKERAKNGEEKALDKVWGRKDQGGPPVRATHMVICFTPACRSIDKTHWPVYQRKRNARED